ncbi:hypothetical protein G7Y89_g3601 [Cudoniella acicularis]|uniref:Uncharacterized protein n=1 Tax=Cudoniella acicularis TaxID=354080 RepID=A0A8H4RS99_9HELO|nr:hypothetical protein G7Y89_g3601 [Cudoniella acicularis]
MLLNAVTFASMLSIGITYSTILSTSPYFLPMKIIALVNLAGAFGSLPALPAAGFMISWVSKRLAMNNGGIKDAEHYLPAFLIPILSGMASTILYGLAAQNKWHYITIYISYFLNSLSFSSLSTATTLWVTEAFPKWAAAALVVVNGLGYMASFGMSCAIIPWAKAQGYAVMNLELALAVFVLDGIVVPIAFWGKRFRETLEGRLAHWSVFEAGALRPCWVFLLVFEFLYLYPFDRF